MRIIQVTTEAVHPTGANTVVENHTEVLSRGEGHNKIIIEANTMVTMDNIIPPVAAIMIIIMAIIKVEVAVAMVETIIDYAVSEEAITETITIINTIILHTWITVQTIWSTMHTLWWFSKTLF